MTDKEYQAQGYDPTKLYTYPEINGNKTMIKLKKQ